MQMAMGHTLCHANTCQRGQRNAFNVRTYLGKKKAKCLYLQKKISSSKSKLIRQPLIDISPSQSSGSQVEQNQPSFRVRKWLTRSRFAKRENPNLFGYFPRNLANNLPSERDVQLKLPKSSFPNEDVLDLLEIKNESSQRRAKKIILRRNFYQTFSQICYMNFEKWQELLPKFLSS